MSNFKPELDVELDSKGSAFFTLTTKIGTSVLKAASLNDVMHELCDEWGFDEGDVSEMIKPFF